MIYLDYNATTPVHPSVLDEMLPYFSDQFANAASHTHVAGLAIGKEVEKCRAQIAALINADPSEIIFTSGATEGINMALKGVFEKYHLKGNHIIACKTEHKAVLDTCDYLKTKGAQIDYVDVDQDGLVNLDQLKGLINEKTIAVAIMMVNNETGIIQPIDQIAELVDEKDSIFISDTTQAMGKIAIDVQRQGIDVLTISGHKLYGPKGVGALYVRRKKPRVVLSPIIHGGGHEKGLRSGTLNVPGIIGMTAALRSSYAAHKMSEISAIRDEVENRLLSSIPELKVIGFKGERVGNTSSLIFPNIHAEKLVVKCPNLAFSLGSACTSALPRPSHVLLAMGYTEEEIKGTIRLSYGIHNRIDEVEEIVDTLVQAYQKLI